MQIERFPPFLRCLHSFTPSLYLFVLAPFLLLSFQVALKYTCTVKAFARMERKTKMEERIEEKARDITVTQLAHRLLLMEMTILRHL